MALEHHTGGRCGFKGYEIVKNAASYYEVAYELSWSTVSYRFEFTFWLLSDLATHLKFGLISISTVHNGWVWQRDPYR